MCRIYFYFDNEEDCLLDCLSVNSSLRNKGEGLKLQKLREKIGKSLGFKKSCLWVEKDKWMKDWYERRGYKYHSNYENYEGDPAIWMKKDLT